MYLIAIAWLYVVVIVSVSDDTVLGGLVTFFFWGLGPLALFLWLFGTPARRRNKARREAEAGTASNDSSEINRNQ
ncbi:MAG: hypothetical protein JNK52_16995 [Zoogloeaceae bacterium]|nr:hypothetical protein [Zoogloeaceae bacterium]